MNSPFTKISVECVVLVFDGNQLKVLLCRDKSRSTNNRWSLISRDIAMNESADDSVIKLLLEFEKKSRKFTIEQLYAYSKGSGKSKNLLIAYLVILKSSNVKLQSTLNYELKWFNLLKPPMLTYEACTTIDKARACLKLKVWDRSFITNILSAKFTMRESYLLFKAINSVEIDRRNFAKKIISTFGLKKLDEKEMSFSKKGSHYYVMK